MLAMQLQSPAPIDRGPLVPRTAIQEYRLSEAGAALYDVTRGTTPGTAVLVM